MNDAQFLDCAPGLGPVSVVTVEGGPALLPRVFFIFYFLSRRFFQRKCKEMYSRRDAGKPPVSFRQGGGWVGVPPLFFFFPPTGFGKCMALACPGSAFLFRLEFVVAGFALLLLLLLPRDCCRRWLHCTLLDMI